MQHLKPHCKLALLVEEAYCCENFWEISQQEIWKILLPKGRWRFLAAVAIGGLEMKMRWSKDEKINKSIWRSRIRTIPLDLMFVILCNLTQKYKNPSKYFPPKKTSECWINFYVVSLRGKTALYSLMGKLQYCKLN